MTQAADLLVVGFDGTEVSGELRRFIEESPPAGVILFSRNIASTEQVAALIRELRALWPADAPAPLVMVDQEGGRVARLKAPEVPDMVALPPMAQLAQGGEVPRTRRAGAAVGKQLAALGFNVDFAPVLDVDSNPGNPIIGERAFGRDPTTVIAHGLAFAAGLSEAGVLACAKHFPGHGDTDLDSHLALPRLPHDLPRLLGVELPPFAAAVAAGVPLVMTAHVVFDALDSDWPATLSPRVLPELLRQRMGFDGVVVSDDLEMAAVADHYDFETMVRQGLRATVDLFLVCHQLDRARAVRDALARQPAEQLAAAHRRVTALRRAAADHAARPWPGALPAVAERFSS